MRVVDFCRRRVLWLIPIGVCLLLIVPMAFTQRTFATDWSNQVWVVWQQKLNLQDIGHPSYFIQNSELGAFYPFFAFYGATLYVLTGLLALPLGTINAVVLVYLAAFAAAYCGWTWLSLQAGLRGVAAYLPGAIAVTAPYAITVAYGRGDFAETAATSMIPLIAASALSIFRADRLRAGPAAALVFPVAILTGTHTITLLWGATLLLGCAALAAVCWGDVIRARANRLIQLAGLSLLGAGISLWYLIPLVTHSSDTVIGQEPKKIVTLTLDSPGELFRPLRNTPQPPHFGADVQAQLPVLALAIAALLVAFAWRGLSRQRRLLVGGLAVLLAGIVLLCAAPSLIDHLPRLWRFVQVPERLVTYADLLIVGLLVLGLAGLRNRPVAFRRATAATAVIAALGVVQAMAQTYAMPSYITPFNTTPHSRDVIFSNGPGHTDPAWYAGPEFADASQPTAQPTIAPPLAVPVSLPRRTTYELTYPAGPAGQVETNVNAGPYLLDIEGGTEVGVTSYQHVVLRLPASRSPRQVTFSPRESAPLVTGQAISALSLLGAVALVAWLALRRRREDRPGDPEGSATTQ